MLRNMEVNLILSALLLICSWGGRAQDVSSPNVNILAELEKIKMIEERLNSQDTIVTLLNSLLEELKRENAARKVAFSASLSITGTGHTGPFSFVNFPLIYKKVFSNYGNGYNSHTGIFTAPLKGVYYFIFYSHCQTGNKMGVSLYKNDQRQCSVFSDRSDTNGNAGNGIILTLEEGDKIHTQLKEHSWVFDNPESFTTFGGFLLFPL